MATQTQPIAIVIPFRPTAQYTRPVVSQQRLAEVLRMRQQPASLDEALDKAEDKIIYALMLGCEVQPGPLTAWEQSWEDPDYEDSFSHLVVVDLSASEGERKAQALHWRPGQWRFPAHVERALARAVA